VDVDDGQTRFASTVCFLLMWLAIMLALMLPAALPMFLITRRSPDALSVTAPGQTVCS
jgi:predicted metal-binding membrane protein